MCMTWKALSKSRMEQVEGMKRRAETGHRQTEMKNESDEETTSSYRVPDWTANYAAQDLTKSKHR